MRNISDPNCNSSTIVAGEKDSTDLASIYRPARFSDISLNLLGTFWLDFDDLVMSAVTVHFGCSLWYQFFYVHIRRME
ncbi:unnamed protein product [Dicrocoelium dendriticum]|nr:unnamed protein product [Dicrocoelium dendriticum]